MHSKPQKSFFVTGIGTDVGKSVISAILVQALNADFIKPVQAGDLENSDTRTIERLVRAGNKNFGGTFFPEIYRLKFPMSPHISAKKSGVEIDPLKFILPEHEKPLIVEGAGGVFVPLTDDFFVIDLISQLKIPAIVVSKHYLGSINHTLLTLEALKQRKVPVAAVIFNGEEIPATEAVIQKRFPAVSYYRSPAAPDGITPEFILAESKAILPFVTSCLNA